MLIRGWIKCLGIGLFLLGVFAVCLPCLGEVDVVAGEDLRAAVDEETTATADLLTEEQIAQRVTQQVLAELQKTIEQQRLAVKAHDDQLKVQLLEEQVKAYKETVEYQKDSLGKILTVLGVLATVILAAVGFVVIKFSRDYKDAINAAKGDVKEAVKEMKSESKDAVAFARELGKEAKEEVKQAVIEMKAESKEAVAQARDSGKEARAACDKAEEWERKTQKEFERVKTEVDEKLKEIDKRAEKRIKGIEKKAKKAAETAVKEIAVEAKKERVLSELWNDALQAYNKKDYEKACELWKQIEGDEDCKDGEVYYNWGTMLADWAKLLEGDAKESKYGEACEKYAKAVEEKLDYHQAFYNWGSTLDDWAELLEGDARESKYGEAGEKYGMAVEIKPDKHDAFYNWGRMLGYWAGLLGGGAKENKYGEACEKYAKAVEIKPDKYDAFYNWGIVLYELAKLLEGEAAISKYSEACEKYTAAVEINSDEHMAFKSWGHAMVRWSSEVDDPEKSKLLDKAIDRYKEVERVGRGAAYDLACVYAIKHDEGQCRHWLGVAEEAGTLETREYAFKDEDLKVYWGADWFREIGWKA